jgi:hypothetical protein
MRRLLSLLLLLAFPIASDAGGLSYAQTTHGQWVLSKMFKPNGVGWPSFAADPFACGAASAGISYYNTTSNENRTCTGAAWVAGGIASPIAGDYVATGRWTWAASAGAANAVDIAETAGQITFEGATGGADAIETRLGATDPTVGDQTYYLPNRGVAVASDTIATLGADNPFTGTNSFSTGINTFGGVAGATDTFSFNETPGQITFEGTGGNAFETRLIFNDPTSDNEIIFNDQDFTVAGRNVDNSFAVLQTFNSSEKQVDNEGIYLGTSVIGAASFIGSRTALTPDSAVIMTGSTSNALHFYELADNAFDFSDGPCTGACTTPTLIGHSATQNTTGWWGLTHNGSNPIASSGLGQWSFPPVAGSAGGLVLGAGAGATLLGTGSYATLLGDGAGAVLTGGDGFTGLGYRAAYTVTGNSAGVNSVCIGYLSCATATNMGSVVGLGASTTFPANPQEVIAIGYLATATGNNQAVIGSATAEVTNLYFNDVLSTAPDPVTINGAGGSGDNIAGAVVTVAGGLGTGAGAPGNVVVQTGRQIGTAATLQTKETRAMVVGKTLALPDESTVNVLAITVPNDTMCALTIQYHSWFQDADEIGGHMGQVSMLVYEEPGAAATYACDVDEETENTLYSDGRTYTDTWSCSAAATSYLTVNFNQENTDVAGTIMYNVTFNSGCVIAPQ